MIADVIIRNEDVYKAGNKYADNDEVPVPKSDEPMPDDTAERTSNDVSVPTPSPPTKRSRTDNDNALAAIPNVELPHACDTA